MIVFDLKCRNAHVFEAWFGSSAGFEDQSRRKLVSCPICDDTAVVKALMAPNIAAKGNRKAVVAPAPAILPSGSLPSDTDRAAPATVNAPISAPAAITPEMMKAALQSLAEIQSKALETSRWVGSAFADRARAMHAGDEQAVPIHGQSTRAEARALVEEGISIAPLLLPVVPPKALN